MKSEKRVLFLLAASVAVILLVTVLMLFPGKGKPAGAKLPTVKPTKAAQIQNVTAEYNRLAMIKEVDTESGTITLYDLEAGGEVTVSYDVAADIRSKYGSLTYAASLKFGDIVRAEYDGEGHLVRMQLSSEHWELHGVENFSVTDSMLSVNGVNYKITENTVAYCGEERIANGEVKSIDRVELCGKDSELLTIRVMKGHGSIRLVNCGELQGAKVTFGNEVHFLEGEPTYFVREGSYTVSVTGEEQAASAEVTVARNEQVVIDLYEYGGAPVQTGEVRFKISPFSAVLRIDGEETDYYERDLVLAYGEHRIEAELGGYAPYKAVLNVSKPYQTIKIDLQERTSIAGGDSATGENQGESGEDRNQEEANGDGTGQNPDGTGEESGNTGTGGGGASDRRYVPIGEAGGYEYDKEFRTFLLEPSGAVVLIDGISLGTAPVEFEKILGTYTITLRKNGKEKEYTVTVDRESFEGDVYWKFPMN